MPVIKSSKKKLRQDKKTTLDRAKIEAKLKDMVKKATTSPSEKNLSEAASALDKAAKKHIVHANKAARIKSRLAQLLHPKVTEKAQKAVEKTKKTVKKIVKTAKKTGAKKAK